MRYGGDDRYLELKLKFARPLGILNSQLSGYTLRSLHQSFLDPPTGAIGIHGDFEDLAT